VVVSFEGSRAFLIEVQALVTAASGSYPRRMAFGIDQNRFALILAVLEKRCGVRLGSSDVYLKVTGGVFLKDPSVDLGVAAAILSSYRDEPLPAGTAFSGELSLSGELRPIPFLNARVKEVEKMGFKQLILPKDAVRKEGAYEPSGLRLATAESIGDLYRQFFP
jgi:DNA repair protein RadA/Sms